MSPPAAGAAAGAFASQPQAGAAFTQLGAATPQEGAAQLGAALVQPFPQLLLQLLQPLLQLLQAKIRSSKQGLQHLVPQPLLQPLLHDGAAAHVGDAAAQVGAAAAQVGAAFTQLGAATPQDGAAQLGAAFAHPLPQPVPQAGLQLRQPLMRSHKDLRQQEDFPQPFPHLSAPHEGAAAQVGLAAAQVGAAAAQVGAAFTQEGAATPHEGATLAQLSQPLPQRVFAHLTLQHLVSQQLVSQPHPLEPSIRSSRSNPKLWVQAASASTNDPTKMFHFIERRLLITMEPSKLTHVPVRPDHANAFALPWGCGWSFAIGQVFRQSNCLKTIAGLLGRWGDA
ncbi:MAG: hypothetical protein ACKVP0_03740 [Pirellulaceae bacterium]